MTLSRLASLALILLPATAHSQILGFTPTHATRESQIEEKLKSIPTPDEERRQHRIFTAEPHVAGSKRNNELAEYIRDEWKKQGFEDVIIRQYDVYGTNPKSASLEMLAPVHYQAALREALEDDELAAAAALLAPHLDHLAALLFRGRRRRRRGLRGLRGTRGQRRTGADGRRQRSALRTRNGERHRGRF